jgi:hypothetical protein
MSDPTPETRTAIVLLNGSRVRPNGTRKIGVTSSHTNPGAAVADWAKIKQLQQKLTSTAVIEIALLNDFHRSVKSVISVALANGARRISHG